MESPFLLNRTEILSELITQCQCNNSAEILRGSKSISTLVIPLVVIGILKEHKLLSQHVLDVQLQIQSVFWK